MYEKKTKNKAYITPTVFISKLLCTYHLESHFLFLYKQGIALSSIIFQFQKLELTMTNLLFLKLKLHEN